MYRVCGGGSRALSVKRRAERAAAGPAAGPRICGARSHPAAAPSSRASCPKGTTPGNGGNVLCPGMMYQIACPSQRCCWYCAGRTSQPRREPVLLPCALPGIGTEVPKAAGPGSRRPGSHRMPAVRCTVGCSGTALNNQLRPIWAGCSSVCSARPYPPCACLPPCTSSTQQHGCTRMHAK